MHSESFDSLCNKLKSIDDEVFKYEQYTQNYLNKYINNIEYEVKLNSYVLCSLFDGVEEPFSELTVLDIGGGVGVMSMMLSAMGVGKVIYLDHNEVVAKDAKMLCEELEYSVDQFVVSDLSTVSSDIRAQIDLVVSRDVVEHLYDLHEVKFTPNEWPGLKKMVHNTSANMYCIWLKHYFKRVHEESEKEGVISYENGEKGFWGKRYDFIRNHLNVKDDSRCRELAVISRGLTYPDIERFVQSGDYPRTRYFEGNTCDPSSGNWAERLVPIEGYREWAELSGLELELKGGILNDRSGPSYVRLVKRGLNILIKNGLCGPTLWPSLMFVMNRSAAD